MIRNGRTEATALVIASHIVAGASAELVAGGLRVTTPDGWTALYATSQDAAYAERLLGRARELADDDAKGARLPGRVGQHRQGDHPAHKQENAGDPKREQHVTHRLKSDRGVVQLDRRTPAAGAGGPNVVQGEGS